MINYSVIREDEYKLVTDRESEIDNIEVHYSYDLNINYYDDNSTDSGDSNYDTSTFLVCMNSFTPLDYSQQAQQYQEKAKEAFDEGDISKYTFFMIESKKFTAKITSVNTKRKKKCQKKEFKKTTSSAVFKTERIAHLMDVIKNAQQELKYLLSKEIEQKERKMKKLMKEILANSLEDYVHA